MFCLLFSFLMSSFVYLQTQQVKLGSHLNIIFEQAELSLKSCLLFTICIFSAASLFFYLSEFIQEASCRFFIDEFYNQNFLLCCPFCLLTSKERLLQVLMFCDFTMCFNLNSYVAANRPRDGKRCNRSLAKVSAGEVL